MVPGSGTELVLLIWTVKIISAKDILSIAIDSTKYRGCVRLTFARSRLCCS